MMHKAWSIGSKVTLVADERMHNETVKNLWNSFSFTMSEPDFQAGDPLTCRCGSTPLPVLQEGKEYALQADGQGFALTARDYGGLMRGFASLLMKIELEQDQPLIRPLAEQSSYRIQNRMLHICVFPENDLYFIKKLIRLAGLCQYTHLVIEFWGMIQFDCLKELAWPNAFTKDEVRELIRQCRELGMEPIPMFNQLGHATGARLCYGKHVVLDQNPRLQRLFTPDGWAWDIESQEVRQLLRQVREELYEVFGPGEFMHVGCDEAYFITRNAPLRQKLPAFLRDLTTEVEKEGRRPMLWMDMLLEKGAFPKCYTVGDKDEVDALRGATAASSVFVDWQYDCTEAPIPSLASLQNCGRDIIGAPWYKPENYSAHIDTVVDGGMYGIMLTTWHMLQKYMHSILGCAKKCGASTFTWSEFSGLREETATLLRRVSFEGNTYADCGWSKEQIEY